MKEKGMRHWSSGLQHPVQALKMVIRIQRAKMRGIKLGEKADVRFPLHTGEYPKNISIGSRATVCECCFLLPGPNSRISIGADCLIAPNVYITTTAHVFTDQSRPIREQGGTEYDVIIGDDVLIGTGVVVLPKVTIGKGAVIGAGSVVTKDVEPYTVMVGTPAKKLRGR